jgi:hypothetical protein
MLVQLDDSVPFFFGYQTLARTVANGNVAPDNLIYESLLQQSAPVIAGTVVFKTGQRTGTTSGVVSSTCFKLRSSDYLFHQLCQAKVTARAGGGDSGAPVFARRRLVANGPERPVALGIVHSGISPVTVNGVQIDVYQSYVFAPLGRIEAALGLRLVIY